MKKKIKVIGPATKTFLQDLYRRESEKYKDPDTSLVITNVEKGTETIDCAFDAAWAAPFALQEVIKSEKEGYDGLIISCFGDPALRAAKEAVKIPVIGAGEASVTFATLLGRKFGIVTAGPPEAGAFLMDNLRMYELDHKCVGVKALGIHVADLKYGSKEEIQRLIEIGRDMIDKGADVLVLGCGGMLGIAEEATRQLDVPIVIPFVAALKMCEAIISMGLAQSKQGFYPPVSKKRVL